MRIERDTMGEMPVPAGAMYGAQTARAVQNFPISGMRLQRPFIRALGLVKACATRVNGANGWVDAAKAHAIERAALEVAAGRYDDQNPVSASFAGGWLSHSRVRSNSTASRICFRPFSE